MIIGVPKEIKDKENRVALTPTGAKQLCASGHSVLVEHDAGIGAGFADTEYIAAGARIVPVAAAWDTNLVLKVKEPLAREYDFLGNQLLFTYLHLAGAPVELTERLLAANTTALAYETLEDATGRLPLLAPMSGVAGNMAVTMGSYYLARFNQGKGTQLGRVLGERHGKVVVIGDGTVGRHAARVAWGMGSRVLIFGRHPERRAAIAKEISPEVEYLLATPESLGSHLVEADLLVGAVLRAGGKAAHVVSEEMVRAMQPGSVIVDVSIDQGGCIATSRPTSHSEPVYIKHGVIHYCVTNMPGAYPRTATLALTNATLPHILLLANHGLAAFSGDKGRAKAINTCRGHITCLPVAEDLGLMGQYRDILELISP